MRLVLRRPILHPWAGAFALAGAGSAVAEWSQLLQGRASYATSAAAVGAAFGSVLIFTESLRRENGAAPTSRPVVACVAAAFAALSLAIAALPYDRGTLAMGTLVAGILIMAIGPLASAPPGRRLSSWAIIVGIIVYAVGRSFGVAARVAGHDVLGVIRIADGFTVAAFGTGLLLHAFARRPGAR